MPELVRICDLRHLVSMLEIEIQIRLLRGLDCPKMQNPANPFTQDPSQMEQPIWLQAILPGVIVGAGAHDGGFLPHAKTPRSVANRKLLIDAASLLPKDLDAKFKPPAVGAQTYNSIICIPRLPISFSTGSDDSANFVLKVILLGDDGEIYDYEVPIESATPQKVADAISAFARRVIEVECAAVVAAKEEAARERERRAELAKVKSEANPLKQRIWGSAAYN